MNDAKGRKKQRRWHIGDVVGYLVADEVWDARLLKNGLVEADSRVVLLDENLSHWCCYVAVTGNATKRLAHQRWVPRTVTASVLAHERHTSCAAWRWSL